MKKKGEKSIVQTAKDFLESDSASATATKMILATVAIAPLAFVGALAPNIIKAMAQGNQLLEKRRSTVKTVVYRLKRNGLIELQRYENGKTRVFLTEKGERYFREHLDDFVVPKKPILWDRRWRVVIFDIPIKRKRFGDIFREKIKNFGFYQLQKSVWVYPYKCEDEILFFARRYGILEFVEVLTVKRLVHGAELRKVFDL